MFAPTLNLMLYVKDVPAEMAFWQAVGFTISNKQEMMGYDLFDMTVTPESTLTFTVMDLAMIEQISPEVADNKGHIMFESSNLEALHAQIAKHAASIGELETQPFHRFEFTSPTGQRYAVADPATFPK